MKCKICSTEMVRPMMEWYCPNADNHEAPGVYYEWKDQHGKTHKSKNHPELTDEQAAETIRKLDPFQRQDIHEQLDFGFDDEAKKGISLWRRTITSFAQGGYFVFLNENLISHSYQVHLHQGTRLIDECSFKDYLEASAQFEEYVTGIQEDLDDTNDVDCSDTDCVQP